MSDVKAARRLEALTRWASSASALGHPVPSDEVLADIAAEPAGWHERVHSPVARAWAPTIDHILHQQKFGVIPDEIVRSLTVELSAPSTPIDVPAAESAPSPAAEPATTILPVDGVSDPVVDALVAWREQRIADGADGADQIKATTLKNLVRFGYTDGETIGKKLPGPAAHLGGEIADIIVSLRESEPAAAAAPTHPAPSPSPEREPPRPAAAAPQSQPASSESATTRHGTTEPPPARPQRVDVGVLDLTHDDFCEYRYQRTGSGDPDVLTPGQIRVTPVDGGVRLSFEAFVPAAGKMVIYRVVAADGSPPRKPEAGDLVGVTTGLQVEDRRDLRAAVRAYQIWCHVGGDVEDAARNNPFLLANGQEVSPVSGFEIHVTEGRISGEWTVFPGASRVRVYRIPLDGVARLDDPQHEICRGESNTEGFADWQAEAGRRYLYRACAEVAVGGSTQLSRPAEEEVTVPVTLTAVDDLEIASSPTDPGRVDIAWTAPPIGRVRIYWDSTRPRADVGQQQDFTESRLQGIAGFREENRIKGPTDKLDGGRARIAGVAWPPDWPRVYVTPVTVLGDQVQVGTTRVETRQLPPVSNPDILERFETEMVTFGWPAEAASVLVYVGSTSTPPEEIVQRNKPIDEIWRTKYERDGGVTFEKKLEPKGCQIVLVPVNYSQREAVHGQLTALNYPGLHRLKYDLVPLRDNPTRYLTELYLTNDLDLDSAIALTMVNRRDRLPLSANDGDPVYFVPSNGGDVSPQVFIPELKKGQHSTGWRADWTRQRGYFRLFITSQADSTKRYALADPSIRGLYLDLQLPVPGVPQ
jgi:hypothetical protein